MKSHQLIIPSEFDITKFSLVPQARVSSSNTKYMMSNCIYEDAHEGLLSIGEVICFVCKKELLKIKPKKENMDICQLCGSNMIFYYHMLVCSTCGFVGDNCNFVFSYYDFERCIIRNRCLYKRRDNFKVILNQFLCTREQIKVPDEVMRTLHDEVNNKENILYYYTIPLSIPIVGCLLERNKLMSYKRSIFYIYFKLVNQPPPHLMEKERVKAQRIFNVVNRLYWNHGPYTRKSFLSYHFVLRKILIVLGKNDFAKYIPQLKTQRLQEKLERIWELITKDPEWVEALQKQRIV